MKKFLLLLILHSTFNIHHSFSQTFWTEDFGTGCNNATPASGYTGANGTWTVTATGTNDNYADVWYVSARANNTGNGQCATGCSNANNPTLHIGNADLSILGVGPDSSCTYLTGVFCSSLNICSTTHRRAESPVIDCTGRIGISISFLWLENGEGADDDATLWYNDGTTWTLIDSLAKTTVCGNYGIWTGLTVNLSVSADNNPSVKIAFNWTNDNDAQGSDPSFAVDNIRLLGSPTSVEENYPENKTNDLFISPNPATNELRVQSAKCKVESAEIYDVLGEQVFIRNEESKIENQVSIDISKLFPGIYFVKVSGEKEEHVAMFVKQ